MRSVNEEARKAKQNDTAEQGKTTIYSKAEQQICLNFIYRFDKINLVYCIYMQKERFGGA